MRIFHRNCPQRPRNVPSDYQQYEFVIDGSIVVTNTIDIPYRCSACNTMIMLEQQIMDIETFERGK